MPRLINSVTGCVVNVDDATAAQLGPEWGDGKTAESEGKPSKRGRPAKGE